MKISLPTENGFLPDKYGKYAPAADRKYDHTVWSSRWECQKTKAMGGRMFDDQGYTGGEKQWN